MSKLKIKQCSCCVFPGFQVKQLKLSKQRGCELNFLNYLFTLSAKNQKKVISDSPTRAKLSFVYFELQTDRHVHCCKLHIELLLPALFPAV